MDVFEEELLAEIKVIKGAIESIAYSQGETKMRSMFFDFCEIMNEISTTLKSIDSSLGLISTSIDNLDPNTGAAEMAEFIRENNKRNAEEKKSATQG
jgi:hypothetical protein